MKRMGRLYFIIITVTALIAVSFLSVESRRQRRVVISEICPHNSTISYDKIGRYSDYVVVSNLTDSVVNLEGYSLSDDKYNLRRYDFPDIDLMPGADLLVRTVALEWYHHGLIDREDLFTNFSLSDGETLYLSSPDGIVEDSVTLPTMGQDEAYIRDGEEWIIGTPKEKEGSDTIVSNDITPPSFSQSSGFYDECFDLKIDASSKEDIYYTINGESPYSDGILYTETIGISDNSYKDNLYANIRNIVVDDDCYYPEQPVDKGVVVRAVAMNEQGEYSKERVATYFVGSDFKKKYGGRMVMSMVINPGDMFSEDSGIYVSGRIWENNKERVREIEADELGIEFSELYPANFLMRGWGWKREAEVELFDINGDSKGSQNVYVSVRGNTSRFISQKSFNIYPIIDDDHKDDSFVVPMTLRHGSGDPSGIREELNSRISEELNVCVQKSECCQLFLNGEYWGNYSLQDKIGVEMISEQCGIDPDNIDINKDFNAESGLEEDYLQYDILYNAVYGAEVGTDMFYKHICDIVDIDSLIDYYCAEIYLGNKDFRDHNFCIWRARKKRSDRYEDGKWRFILYDVDESMSNPETDVIETVLAGGSLSFDLFSKLYNNAEFRERFNQRMMVLSKEFYSYKIISPIICDIADIYEQPMILSERRFEDADYNMDQFESEIDVIRDFFRFRPDYIRKSLR